MIYSEIYTNEKNVEFVNDEHGNAYRVFESKNYNNEKYIKVCNRLNTDDEYPFNKLFSGRIKDAIETIRNGDGDALVTTKFIVNITDVIYFLNREFGEKIRKQSLDGWKNAEFGWIIKFGNRRSLSGPYPLNDKNVKCGPLDNDSPAVFNTREEAEDHVAYLMHTAKQYAEKYASLAHGKSKDAIEKLQKDMFHELDDKYKVANVILDLVFDMLDDNLSVVDNYNLSECAFKIEQYLIQ